MVAESIALSVGICTKALSMIRGSLQKRARSHVQNASKPSDDEPEPAAAEARETGEAQATHQCKK
ncbi:hypothetical protein JG688_00008701 [Phytophthora aleatoria]|uniref:Uncharacterized protein n=1 Tax=Phytophthora aleatoria TaxID=2496075 RepID=A0A8J5ISC0_9STRA|nr:hypothetical protein JG688_00008701 [Phytophthora aleatoria]